MVRFYAFLFFVFNHFGAAYAQGLPGYIITLQGDTLSGSIAEKKHQRLILYPSGSAARQSLRASQVQGYGLLGRPAIRSQVVHMASGADSTFFVLPVQKGPVALYSYANETGTLLQPAASDTLQELTALNWQLLSNRYLQGCPTLNPASAEVLDMRFTTENVGRVIRRYNDGMGAPKQPKRLHAASPWRYGLGLQVGAVPITQRAKALFTKEKSVAATGWARQAGIELSYVRASGVQVNLGASYKQLDGHSSPYLVEQNSTFPLEQQDYDRVKLLTTTFAVGRRLGRPDRPSFYGSVGLGLNLVMQVQGYSQQRVAGTTAGFKRIDNYSEVDEDVIVLPHLDVQGGVLFPLSKHQEVRLTAIYQNYVFSHLQGAGAQLAYTWFWK